MIHNLHIMYHFKKSWKLLKIMTSFVIKCIIFSDNWIQKIKASNAGKTMISRGIKCII